MGMDSWTCLMVGKGPGMLTEGVMTVLKAAACDLHRNGVERMKLDHNLCMGFIQTEWNTHTVGSRSGVLFHCQIESEAGEYFVNFLLNTKDLEAGADILRQLEEAGESGWGIGIGTLPIPKLYEFRDLRPHRMH